MMENKEFKIEVLLRKLMEKSGKITEEEKKMVADTLSDEIRKKPFKVAIIGQGGVGKTSTIQSVFGVKPTKSNKIKSVEEGTTDVEEKVFDIEDGFSVSISDMPGLKNDITKDEKVYIPLYKSILPGCDLIIYVIDAHAKELGIDIKILRDTVIPICREAGITKNIIIAINKIDTIGQSFPEYKTNKEYHWDRVENRPTETLSHLIDERLHDIYRRLTKENILEYIDIKQTPAYSAVYAYNMRGFFEAILQSERGWIFAGTVAEDVMAKPSEHKLNVR